MFRPPDLGTNVRVGSLVERRRPDVAALGFRRTGMRTPTGDAEHVTVKEAAIRARRRTAALAAPLVATAALWGASCTKPDVKFSTVSSNPPAPTTLAVTGTTGTNSAIIGNRPAPTTLAVTGTTGDTNSSIKSNPPAPTTSDGDASTTSDVTSGR